MYFPFLRGKQNELLALRECVDKLAESGEVIPIIEPVNCDSAAILRCVNILSEKGVKHILVFNSHNGDIGRTPSEMARLVEEVKSKVSICHFAFIIDNTTQPKDINYFLNSIGDDPYSFIHSDSCSEGSLLCEASSSPNFQYHIFIESGVSKPYQNQFRDFKRVVISNSFRSVNKNSEYSDPNHEFYTNAHLTYKTDGLTGFGDYTILSDRFRSGGGQPYSAALHLTHEADENKGIWVRHFLSEVYDYPISDQAALIHEALPEMVKFITQYKDYFSFSESVEEILKIHEEGRATSLGNMKKLSIKHHIELLLKIL